MVNIITDKYKLTQTGNIIILLPGQENKSDLSLPKSQSNFVGGSLQGVINDELGNPIEGALIKLMSQSYDPIMHTMSDSNGQYTLSNIPVNKTFKVYAIAKGKFLKEGSLVNVIEYQKVYQNFVLKDDPSSSLAVIAGDVLDLNSSTPIKGAIVELYFKNNGNEDLVVTTKGNDYGQFTFRDLALGDYNVIISASGYSYNSSLVSITSKGQIIPLKVSLIQSQNNSNGTVSGIINDEMGNVVKDADVILYRVEGDNGLTPIKFTKTNSNGVYLFQDVPKATYKIKANERTTVTVLSPISPNYYGFTIGTATTLIPKVTYVKYEANLYNGAMYVLNNSFVSGIGGDLGGYITINLNAKIPGYYDVTISYLSGNFDTSIILQQDPNNNGTKIKLNFSKTTNWNIKSAKTITIRLQLNDGINEFKLFNTLINSSPWIGNFKMSYVEQSYTADMIDGNVDKGAMYLAPFVTFLGGPTNGEVNILIDVPFTKIYKLEIEYLSGDTDRPLKLDVDGVNVASLTLPKTNDWSLLSAKIYELPISLAEGARNFRFYNDTGQYAANVGELTFDEYIINTSFPPKDINLLNGASLQTDITGTQYITGIAIGKGKIQFSVNIIETQLYDFKILYSCLEDRVCNLTVNGQLVDYVSFIFKATGNSVKTFYTQLFLTKGTNIITIFNE